ncbi:MAG: C4-type zinc ribbon domain-containing protein [Acidobacteriota bacterium]
MKDQIRRLVRLQDILFEIRTLDEQVKVAPAKFEALEQSYQQSTGEIGAARVRHEALLQDRSRLYREREEVSSRLQQLQQKLMQVSNQREYSAALNEIDFSKHSLASLEEQILSIEQQIEELSGPASEADARMLEERQRVNAERGTLEQEATKVSHRLADLTALRDLIVKELPPGFYTRFESICRARGGVAVSKIEGEACSACRMRLRPHLINQVRRGVELITCDSCRRILYWGDFGNESTAAEGEPAPDEPAGVLTSGEDAGVASPAAGI